MLFWEAFNELSHSRPSSFNGVASIPVSEIEAYCRVCGFDGVELRHQLLSLVQALDAKYIELIGERAEVDAKNQGKK